MSGLSGELRVQADRIKEPLAAEVVINKTSALLRDAASLIDQQEKALEAADEAVGLHGLCPPRTLPALCGLPAYGCRGGARGWTRHLPIRPRHFN